MKKILYCDMDGVIVDFESAMNPTQISYILASYAGLALGYLEMAHTPLDKGDALMKAEAAANRERQQ